MYCGQWRRMSSDRLVPHDGSGATIDVVDPPASLEADLLPVIPGARMTVIAGTGHLSPLEVPDQIANQIDQFVDSLDPAHY